MADGVIILTKVPWTPIPDNPLPVTVYIKDLDDPDEDMYYRIVESGVILNADGTFSPPYEISNLDRHHGYTVKIITLCQSKVVKKDFPPSELWAAYSYGFSLGFFS